LQQGFILGLDCAAYKRRKKLLEPRMLLLLGFGKSVLAVYLVETLAQRPNTLVAHYFFRPGHSEATYDQFSRTVLHQLCSSMTKRSAAMRERARNAWIAEKVMSV
jgi:hypothetical protein